jgi:excisionase family DNA binding protein
VDNQWLTANEAAAYLRVQPRTILKWAKAGTIPAHALSGCRRITWRFLREELDRAMLNPASAAGLEGPIEQQN